MVILVVLVFRFFNQQTISFNEVKRKIVKFNIKLYIYIYKSSL